MAGWAQASQWLGSTLAVTEPERAEAGPTALLIVILLGIGIVFLGRSMIKHIRRVPASFDGPASPSSPAPPTARSEPVDPNVGPAPADN